MLVSHNLFFLFNFQERKGNAKRFGGRQIQHKPRVVSNKYGGRNKRRVSNFSRT